MGKNRNKSSTAWQTWQFIATLLLSLSNTAVTIKHHREQYLAIFAGLLVMKLDGAAPLVADPS